MEKKTAEKALDLVNNTMKVAANFSKEPEPKHIPVGDSDNSNNASTGMQSVNVMLDTKKPPKPVEKHIHTYPENRPLTNEECELDLKKAQMEFELKRKEQEFNERISDRIWNHALEVEKKNEKKGRIRRVIGGLVGAVSIGVLGYCIWSDYRDNKAGSVAQKTLPKNNNITAEGTVE